MFKFNFEIEGENDLDSSTAEIFGGLDPTVPQDAIYTDEAEVPARETSLETLVGRPCS